MHTRQRLEVALRPSRLLGWALVAAHTGALLAALLVELPVWARAVLGVAIAGSLLRSLARHATRSAANACTGVLVSDDGRCVLRLHSGATVEGTVDTAASAVSVPLIVLRVRPDDGGRTIGVVLAPDSAERDALRALRVLLRFGLATPVSR
jgi:hypothetical protein